MTPLTIAVAASQCGQQNVAAQVQVVNSIRLELRIQPQVGLPGEPGGVVDVAGSVHLPLTGPGQVRRFEVQYRLLDLDPDDGVTPLIVSNFQFMLGFTGGGSASLERAVLSRAETTPSTAPAATPDLSGLPSWATTPARQARGLHSPFLRTAHDPAEFPFNDCPENGRFFPGPGGPDQIIRDIAPLQLPGGPITALGVWYGVYSFNFVSAAAVGDHVTLNATLAIGTDGTAFSFETNDSWIPSASPNVAIVGATIPIPAPSGLGAGGVIAIGAIWPRRRRACAGMTPTPFAVIAAPRRRRGHMPDPPK